VSMNLTPRLVAKLLTQSYRGSVVGSPGYLSHNPIGLTLDPEFLDLNPDYQGFAVHFQPPDALVQLGSSDLISLLWSWVITDPDARDFLAGKPDQHDMVVNKFNQGLTLPVSSFPRLDQSCIPVSFSGASGMSCTSDGHPFFNDMHAAAL